MPPVSDNIPNDLGSCSSDSPCGSGEQGSRHLTHPCDGPKLLFFSGGSAVGPVATKLIDYTHHSIHLITPFDSGGSSRELRFAFDMPAIGDLRNRLMALADHSISANKAIYRLFSHRLYSAKEPLPVKGRLARMAAGKDPLVMAIVQPLRAAVIRHLQHFQREMPDDISLEGACIGNLVLASGYLLHKKSIDPVIELYSKFILARGLVKPIVSDSYHLFAEYNSGETILGQHVITRQRRGDSWITKIGLSHSEEQLEPVLPSITPAIASDIARAQLICYPIGSFFTSLCATLLPAGIGEAIAANPCPKVYIPNTTSDTENHGLTVNTEVEHLLGIMRSPTKHDLATKDLLGYVLLDENLSHYPRGVDIAALEAAGIKVIRAPLVTGKSTRLIDPLQLIKTLFALINSQSSRERL